MEFKLDDEGYILDAEGKRIEINGEPVKVGNAKNQTQVDAAIKERLNRQTEKIKTLEAQATRTPELEKMLTDLKTEKTQLEEQLANAKKAAEQEVATQLSAASEKAKKYEQELAAEREGRVRDQVSNLVLSKAGDRFINPARDIVPELLGAHKREPVKDSAGNKVEGQHLDLFKMTFKNEKGEEVTDFLPVEKALEVVASNPAYQHYVRGSGAGGSGGGKYANTSNLKRSAMSPAQKAEFVGAHGVEAYQGLPE